MTAHGIPTHSKAREPFLLSATRVLATKHDPLAWDSLRSIYATTWRTEHSINFVDVLVIFSQ
jgi:hypothetical protein